MLYFNSIVNGFESRWITKLVRAYGDGGNVKEKVDYDLAEYMILCNKLYI